MRNLFLFIFFILFDLSFNSAFAVEAKYSCHYDLSPNTYLGKDMCKDHGYIYSSPVAAAKALGLAQEQYHRQAWLSDFIGFYRTNPECIKLSTPYYAFSCTYTASLKRKDRDGKVLAGDYETFYVSVTAQHSCQEATVIKGSIGAVIPSQTNGKRYVLSQSPGETVCTSSCNYDFKGTEKCYLTIGSQTEGFCNFNYVLKTINGVESTCITDPNIKPAEIGDELGDKCPEGYEFANGSKMCTPIPCPEGFERLDGGEICTAIPGTPGGDAPNPGGGTNPGAGDGGPNPGGGTNPGGDGGTNPGDGNGGVKPGGNGGANPGGNGGTNPGGSDGGKNPGGETFTNPGYLDLSASVAGRGDQAKSQVMDMKQKMVSSNTFTAAKTAYSASSHASAICPVGSVTLFAKEIVFDSHCKLFLLIAPVLKAVFIAIWSFLAVRIVLTA